MLCLMMPYLKGDKGSYHDHEDDFRLTSTEVINDSMMALKVRCPISRTIKVIGGKWKTAGHLSPLARSTAQ